jgi:hypothetical protein
MKVAETNGKCSPNLSRPTQILRTITTYIAFVNPNSDVVSIRLDELSECQTTSIVLALFPAFSFLLTCGEFYLNKQPQKNSCIGETIKTSWLFAISILHATYKFFKSQFAHVSRSGRYDRVC